METFKTVTCIAPINIAVIKYWGKRDEKLILPLNDSVSVTLDVDTMHAKTTVTASASYKENKFWLNGREESFDNPRIQNCLSAIQKRTAESENEETKKLRDWKIHICSENNFPTAAGLASSAAGYACLVYTLAQLYAFTEDISALARQGSGSACRSVYGGFVQWCMGQQVDGSDSVAKQVAPASHWSELHCLVLVVDSKQKKTSSTSGMRDSVVTSDLLKHRVKHCVPKRTADIIQAINNRDFATFAEITMKDSNQFHAVCLDTFPPAVYMNDTSHNIAGVIHLFNSTLPEPQVAYTFDAGPNCCLFVLEKSLSLTLALINYMFPGGGKDYMRGEPITKIKLPLEIKQSLGVSPYESGLISHIIHTKVGEGPKLLEDISQSLLDQDGVPKKLSISG